MTEICPICSGELKANETVCSRCGYKLPGNTHSFTPVKISEDERKESSSPRKQAELRIIRGPQTGISMGLREGLLTIGRNPQCDIFLNDMTVSRVHATIDVTSNGAVLTDKNSYNGVWVNNENISQRKLVAGDVIQIGSFCLQYVETLKTPLS